MKECFTCFSSSLRGEAFGETFRNDSHVVRGGEVLLIQMLPFPDLRHLCCGQEVSMGRRLASSHPAVYTSQGEGQEGYLGQGPASVSPCAGEQ